jgi:hypothetical protein
MINFFLINLLRRMPRSLPVTQAPEQTAPQDRFPYAPPSDKNSTQEERQDRLVLARAYKDRQAAAEEELFNIGRIARRCVRSGQQCRLQCLLRLLATNDIRRQYLMEEVEQTLLRLGALDGQRRE